MIRRFLLFILISITLVGIVLAGIAIEFLNAPASQDPGVTIFEFAPGTPFKSIAKKLEAEGLVTSSAKLILLAKINGAAKQVRVGEYEIPRNALPREILRILTSGKSIEHLLTVSEGLTMFDIADIVDKKNLGMSRSEFLKLCQDPLFIKDLLGESRPTLEGYLFPETYAITKFTGTRGLIRLMVNRFLQVYKQIEISPNESLSRHQLVTLASIVEKETGAPEERSVISSVFHNRLRIGMRLQTDPTVLYGMLMASHITPKNITRADLLHDNPWNTYTRLGLPFGPIANPGREALVAAANPAASEFLYFVSQNNGTHVFSKDYTNHQKAVTSFQLNKKARESGSWRDLKNRNMQSAAKHAEELRSGK